MYLRWSEAARPFDEKATRAIPLPTKKIIPRQVRVPTTGLYLLAANAKPLSRNPVSPAVHSDNPARICSFFAAGRGEAGCWNAGPSFTRYVECGTDCHLVIVFGRSRENCPRHCGMVSRGAFDKGRGRRNAYRRGSGERASDYVLHGTDA